MKISQLSMMSLGMMVALSACSVESKMDPIAAIPIPPGPAAPAPSKASAVDGSWNLACAPQDGFYQNETMKFSGGKFETTVSLFQSSTCSGAPMFEQKVEGTYTIGQASATVTGGTDVDVLMANPETGALEKFYLVVVVEGQKMYLPPQSHDSSKSRATSVDRAKPYAKIGG